MVSRHAGRRHRGADPEGDRPHGGDGLQRAPLHRGDPHRAGRRSGRRTVRSERPRAAATASGRPCSISEPYKLVGPHFRPGGTVVKIGGVKIGGDAVVVMAGPCRWRTESQMRRGGARRWPRAGARVLRGGAFKPRTSPYSFQGLGEEGLADAARGRRPTAACWWSARSWITRPDRRWWPRYADMPADRRAQHAELRPAAGAGQACASRCC